MQRHSIPLKKRIIYAIQYVPCLITDTVTMLLPRSLRPRFTDLLTKALFLSVPLIRRRIFNNLRLIFPEQSQAQLNQTFRACQFNYAHNWTEVSERKSMKEKAKTFETIGDGIATIENQQKSGSGAVIVSAHFGSWDAVKYVLAARGIHCTLNYRPLNNPYYRKRTQSDYTDNFTKGFGGNRQVVKHLKQGGFHMILPDQYYSDGIYLQFMGQPARTTLGPAKLALRHNLPLIPAYAIRLPDKKFRVEFDAPIPHSDPAAMMQTFNDSLDRRVRRYPGQWLWLHRRWKIR